MNASGERAERNGSSVHPERDRGCAPRSAVGRLDIVAEVLKTRYHQSGLGGVQVARHHGFLLQALLRVKRRTQRSSPSATDRRDESGRRARVSRRAYQVVYIIVAHFPQVLVQPKVLRSRCTRSRRSVGRFARPDGNGKAGRRNTHRCALLDQVPERRFALPRESNLVHVVLQAVDDAAVARGRVLAVLLDVRGAARLKLGRFARKRAFPSVPGAGATAP